MRIEFYVEGVPAPGGSKTAMPLYNADGSPKTTPTAKGKQKPVLVYVDQSKKRKRNTGWRDAVAWTGKKRMQELGASASPLRGPVVLSVVFVMPRPKRLKGDAYEPHTSAPDVTKLLRSTEDSLTGIVWMDDKQIIKQDAEKRYASRGEPPGARVVVVGDHDSYLVFR